MRGALQRRLSELLREAPLPEASEAERRSWEVVRAAFDETPRPAAPRPRGRTLVAVAAGAVVAGALALTPAGAEVVDLIRDAVGPGVEQAEPELSSLPAPGEVLVEAGNGAWIVRGDGSKRLLGEYEQASWSPNGLYVAVSAGHTLKAVDPVGQVRWTLSRPAAISDPTWSESPGVRVAYRSGSRLRVVAGDGTSETLARTLVSADVAPVAPAWQPVFDFKLSPALPPEGIHVLAYAPAAGGVEVVDTDTGETVWRPPLPRDEPVRELSWSADGETLVVRTERNVYELGGGADGAPRASLPAGSLPTAAALSPDGRSLAVASTTGGGALKSAELSVIDRDGDSVPLFAGLPGTFTDLAWSPDGGWLLVAWRETDQWLFVRPDQPRRIVAVGDIREQFDPGGDAARGGVPSLGGWILPHRAP